VGTCEAEFHTFELWVDRHNGEAGGLDSLQQLNGKHIEEVVYLDITGTLAQDPHCIVGLLDSECRDSFLWLTFVYFI
jgi:hypothetical protein